MDVMLSILGATDPNGYDADTINKATSLILIAGGTDTTSVTLTWAISLLLNNPHVLRKAQEELDTHVGKERLVNEMDISKLVYLQAIVKETLRLYPAAPLSGQRQFIQDSVLGGYHIPKGTRLLLNLTKIQRDPRVWLNPTKFQPSRFLTTYKDVDVKDQNYDFSDFIVKKVYVQTLVRGACTTLNSWCAFMENIFTACCKSDFEENIWPINNYPSTFPKVGFFHGVQSLTTQLIAASIFKNCGVGGIWYETGTNVSCRLSLEILNWVPCGEATSDVFSTSNSTSGLLDLSPTSRFKNLVLSHSTTCWTITKSIFSV
ncbi:unnamed protein product, partial [Vitis vinifera]